MIQKKPKIKNIMSPFYGRCATVSRLQSHLRYSLHAFYQVPMNSWYSFDQPRKDQRLRLPWRHPINDFCSDNNVDVTTDRKDACNKTCTKTLLLTMLIKITFSK